MMSEETRFDSLMDALSGDDEPEGEAKQQQRKKSKVKSKDPDYTQIGLYLPHELHRRMKIGAAIKGLELSDLAAIAITEWLNENIPDN